MSGDVEERSESLTPRQLGIQKRLKKLKQRLLDHHLTHEEVDRLCEPDRINLKFGRLNRRKQGEFEFMIGGRHFEVLSHTEAWEIKLPLPDLRYMEDISHWINQAKECSRQLSQKPHRWLSYRMLDDLRLMEVIPPVVKNAQLKTFVHEVYTKLKYTFDEKCNQLKESENQGIVLFGIAIRDPGLLENLCAVCDGLRDDMISLYQWILKEDEDISQESAPVDRLHELLVWLSWIASHLIEDAHRGGFRNLLLDGWWLEFWEIILLAAGDVERNPGPRQITGK